MEGLFLPLLLMLVIAIPLVLSSRKQKRMMAQQQELQNSLREGDRVMTTSGLYATVVDVSDESTVDLEIAEDVVTTWLRQAVRERIDLVDDEDSAVDEDDADAEDSVADKGPQVAAPLEHGKN